MNFNSSFFVSFWPFFADNLATLGILFMTYDFAKLMVLRALVLYKGV